MQRTIEELYSVRSEAFPLGTLLSRYFPIRSFRKWYERLSQFSFLVLVFRRFMRSLPFAAGKLVSINIHVIQVDGLPSNVLVIINKPAIEGIFVRTIVPGIASREDFIPFRFFFPFFSGVAVVV
jgi:hypothetical protein